MARKPQSQTGAFESRRHAPGKTLTTAKSTLKTWNVLPEVIPAEATVSLDLGRVLPTGRSRKLTFGSVTVKAGPADRAELRRNAELGGQALERMGEVIVTPGVRLRAARSVPMYHADPKHPGRLIRVLDGRRESGAFVDGEFKPAS
jgi:hypothetical protein